ncbi:MAG: response regulator [Acidobacteriota bacterium]|nr:response regulator [Acidobacteriota bacterium]
MSQKPIILVVDDDLPILVLMRSLLREFGYEAVTAENGIQALAEARARRPSLVLIDKNMPGMTGAEVIRSLRNEPGLDRVPILILSGEPVSHSELASLRADGAVLKPFDVTALVDQIRAYVRTEDVDAHAARQQRA